MKRLIGVCLAIFLSAVSIFAQKPVQEPEFAGDVLYVKDDNTVELLDKRNIQYQTKGDAGWYLVGIGKERTKLKVKGAYANTRIAQSDQIIFIIKGYDNNIDPAAVIEIFRFDTKSNSRKAEISSVSSFGAIKENNLSYVPFEATKCGDSSYIVTLNQIRAGEYGVIVSLPQSLSTGKILVSCFGIDTQIPN